MHEKSLKIDNHFAALREENLRDMKRTERRLSLLIQKPQLRDSVIGVEFDKIGDDSNQSEEDDNKPVDHDKLPEMISLSEQFKAKYAASSPSKDKSDNSVTLTVSDKSKDVKDLNHTNVRKKYASRRASALTDQLLKFIPEEKTEVDGDTSDIRYGSMIALVLVLILAAFMLMFIFVFMYSDDSDSDSDDGIPPPPPPPKTAKQIQSNTAANSTNPNSNANKSTIAPANGSILNEVTHKDKLTFDPTLPQDTEPDSNIPNIVAYKRIFDSQFNRHYYVSLATSESQWNVPTEGIVECK